MLLFSLYNTSVWFLYYINKILAKNLDIFVIIYFDIII